MRYDTTEAQNVMREIFLGRITKGFEESTVLLGIIDEAGSEFVHEKGLDWAVYLEPNPSMKFIGSGGLLPGGSTSKKKRHKVTYTTFTMARRLDGQVLHTDRNSIIKGLMPLVKEDTETFSKAMNVLSYGNGDNRLAVVAAAPAGTGAIQMKKPNGSSLLWKRGKYNIVDPADGTKRTMTIGGVAKSEFYLVTNSKSTSTAGFADAEDDAAADAISATTIVEGDIVVFADSYGLGFHGLAYHLNNTGLYQNLSRSTYPDQLNPALKDMLEGPLTVAGMDWLEVQVTHAKGGKSTMDSLFWLFSETQLYGYRKLGYNTDTKVVKQFAGADVKLDLGWRVFEHNGRPLKTDVDCPPNEANLLDRSSFKKLSAMEPGLVEAQGQYLQLVPGFDSAGVGSHLWQYIYYLAALQDIANMDILNNGKLNNLDTEGLPTRSS
ncbi:MAG: hypothetical protein WBV94_21770 [Blastocatellia bacterium]